MTSHENLSPALTTWFLRSSITSLGARIAAWATTCADYYVAAAMYEQLSGLSDAELARRGLSRANLAQDICVACDRTTGR